jgi:hypothetical protein
MAQLWVNLPARHKMSPPRYQTILNADIPQAALEPGAGSIRVIAGHYQGIAGPAATFSAMNVWDVRLEARRHAILSVAEGHSAALAVLRGTIVANASRQAQDAELVVFERGGTEIEIEAAADSTLLFLSGAPIPEPIVGYGPFVMNSRQEIETAMSDFRLGKFGRMPRLQG